MEKSCWGLSGARMFGAIWPESDDCDNIADDNNEGGQSQYCCDILQECEGWKAFVGNTWPLIGIFLNFYL